MCLSSWGIRNPTCPLCRTPFQYPLEKIKDTTLLVLNERKITIDANQITLDTPLNLDEREIAIVQSQAAVTRQQAIEALMQYGNLVDAILNG